jgi:hypothetical protein
MARKKSVRHQNSKRPIEYYPPSQKDIEHYAAQVCRQLESTLNDDYNTAEFRQELSGFLSVVASICIKALNKRASESLDSESSQE